VVFASGGLIHPTPGPRWLDQQGDQPHAQAKGQQQRPDVQNHLFHKVYLPPNGVVARNVLALILANTRQFSTDPLKGKRATKARGAYCR
jgi:hypothetical protein